MRSSIRLVLFAAVLLRAAPASADLITIEPDSYAPGTNVSHAGAGATLWTLTANNSATTPLSLSDVYTRSNPACVSDPFQCDAVTGSQGFSPNSDGEGRLYGNWDGATYVGRCFTDVHTGVFGGSPFHACADAAGQQVMLIQFDTATDFVEISGAWNNDFTIMVAFDGGFNYLGGTNQIRTLLPDDGDSYHESTVTLTSPTTNIRYVIAGSVGDATSLDALRYRLVPEPSTLALCAVGLVGLLKARNRFGAASSRRRQGRLGRN